MFGVRITKKKTTTTTQQDIFLEHFKYIAFRK